jgi:hypothetical protein
MDPDRKGLIMMWGQDCQPVFVSLAAASEQGVPDGVTGSEAAIPSPDEMH